MLEAGAQRGATRPARGASSLPSNRGPPNTSICPWGGGRQGLSEVEAKYERDVVARGGRACGRRVPCALPFWARGKAERLGRPKLPACADGLRGRGGDSAGGRDGGRRGCRRLGVRRA